MARGGVGMGSCLVSTCEVKKILNSDMRLSPLKRHDFLRRIGYRQILARSHNKGLVFSENYNEIRESVNYDLRLVQVVDYNL